MTVTKPEAVKEVEATVDTAMTDAWAKLDNHEETTDQDMLLIIQAARADRQRWMIKKRKAGDDNY